MEVVKLKKVANIYDGIHETPNYEDSGVRFVSVEDIKNLYQSNKYISHLDYNKLYTIKPEFNDILMTRIGDIGTTSICDKEEPLAYYVSLALIKPISINPNYLYFALQSQLFKKESYKRTIHVAFPKKINLSEIGECLIPLLEKDKQTKIATFLNLYYKKIELQKKKVDLLKLQKHQIINDIFKIQDKTNYIKLSKLLNQISIKNKNNLDVPVLSVSNKFGFIPQNEQFEEEVASDDKSNYKLVKLNQFAYNPARINVGSIAKLMEPYSCGQISPMYICFECDSKINNDFLGYYLLSSTFKKEMQKRLEGSVRMCLTFESMCNIKISLPGLSEQQLVVNKLKKIDLKIKTEETKLLLLEKYKQGLLQKMFI